jgi:hypothetical protein
MSRLTIDTTRTLPLAGLTGMRSGAVSTLSALES